MEGEALTATVMTITGEASKERFIAAFIDNLVAIALMFFVVIFIPEGFPVLKGVAIVGIYLAYFAVLEALWSRTLGKYFQGLVVRKLNGEPCDWTAAAIRSVLRVVEVNPLLLAGFPPDLWLFRPRESSVSETFLGERSSCQTSSAGKPKLKWVLVKWFTV